MSRPLPSGAVPTGGEVSSLAVPVASYCSHPSSQPVFSHPFTNGLDLPLCKSTYRQPHLPLGKAELWVVGGWNGNSCVWGRRPGMQVWAWGKKELFPPLTVAPGQGRMLSEDASKATQPGVKPGPS